MTEGTAPLGMRQLELGESSRPGARALRISANCPNCEKALVFKRPTPDSSYLECPDLKCGFVEARDQILVKLLDTIMRQRSAIAQLGGGII